MPHVHVIMAKRKDRSPLEGGASYADILGIDRKQIREKIRRRDETTDAESLLTSNDLFGDIIEGFDGEEGDTNPNFNADTGEKVGSPSPDVEGQARPPTETVVYQRKPKPGQPPEAYSLLDVAYSSLLKDPRLNEEVSVDPLGDPDVASFAVGPKSDDKSEYGSYFLLNRIATGGMAEVFRAKRKGVEGFEKMVAVKRILPHLSPNKAFVEMFIDEAKMVASLSHPNIVQIFDLGKIDDSYYIAMEYVDGRDLRSILTRTRTVETSVNVDLAALIVSKVGSALEYAHRHRTDEGHELRIVHRDVSPQNILISKEGETKLVDFGIAKAAIKASHTDSGSLRGKLLYMSPEQAWGRPIDKRSDIFSLGAVFFEILTGHPLFSGGSEMSILERVRAAKVKAPSSLNPAVPIELEAIVAKALQREPDDRYQDTSEMLRDLDSYLRRRPAVGPAELAQFIGDLFRTEEIHG